MSEISKRVKDSLVQGNCVAIRNSINGLEDINLILGTKDNKILVFPKITLIKNLDIFKNYLQENATIYILKRKIKNQYIYTNPNDISSWKYLDTIDGVNYQKDFNVPIPMRGELPNGL